MSQGLGVAGHRAITRAMVGTVERLRVDGGGGSRRVSRDVSIMGIVRSNTARRLSGLGPPSLSEKGRCFSALSGVGASIASL
jgi:hypothetical protein